LISLKIDYTYKPWEINIGVSINNEQTNITQKVIPKINPRKPKQRKEKEQKMEKKEE